jgi:hypothetical protein
MSRHGMGMLMKQFLIATASTFALAGAAVAADLPVRQPPPTPVAGVPIGKFPVGKAPIGKAPIGKFPVGKGPAVVPVVPASGAVAARG